MMSPLTPAAGRISDQTLGAPTSLFLGSGQRVQTGLTVCQSDTQGASTVAGAAGLSRNFRLKQREPNRGSPQLMQAQGPLPTRFCIDSGPWFIEYWICVLVGSMATVAPSPPLISVQTVSPV